jgi:hypothetical protein
MPRPSYMPEPATRGQVEAMAAYGIPEKEVAAVLRIDPKTLRKHYRHELDLGQTKANAQVAGFLFNAAKNGNVTAQIFWLKTRAGWKEPPVPPPAADEKLQVVVQQFTWKPPSEPLREIEAQPLSRTGAGSPQATG